MAISGPLSSASSSVDRSQSNSIFISYASEDFESAIRLFNDLKKEGYDPWLDKKSILPGQNWDNEIKKAIKSSGYLIILFSSNLVEKISYIQKEIKDAIEEQQNFPESFIFIIPARLDSSEISYKGLEKIQYVDLFPNWNEGFKKILQSLSISNNQRRKDKKEDSKESEIYKIKDKIASSLEGVESTLSAYKFELFKGEKRFFVGRGKYINEIIKKHIKIPTLKVCIIGPGGSGKSQLAFKAIHQYEKEGLFDLVVPVYFSDVSKMSFSDFLLSIAKSLFDVIDMQVFEKMDNDNRKIKINSFLSQRKHPLLFLDNYETVSYVLNDQNQQINSTEQYEEAVKISYYINNELQTNTSVLVTSRERNNNFEDKERRIDLEGLQEQESIQLFTQLTNDGYLKNMDNIMRDPDARSAIEKIFNMTGGHPLAIEIIAKNTSNINQINQMADTLGLGIVNPNEPDKRLRSLEASFNYTISRLPDNIKKLLYALTIFKSPFPINVAEKVFNEDINFIIELHNRSLLLEIKSETSFGQIANPKYWLYSIHPAIRNYLERTIQRGTGKSCHDLEVEYSYNFYRYYYDVLGDIYNSIGKEDVHRSSMARFNLVYNQGSENNDFNRALKFAEDNNRLWYCANISRIVGLILYSFGMFSKALEYCFKSLGFNQRLNDKDGLSTSYKDIGNMYRNMGNHEQALEYHNKALDIDTELNDRARLAADYTNIGNVFWNMGKYEQALESYNKALVIDTELNDRVGLAADYKGIGVVYWNMGKYEQDLEYHNKALEKDTELNDRVGLALDYRNIGNVYDDMGNHQQALEHYNKALAIDTQLNDRVGMAKNYYNLSFPLYNMNKKKESLEHLSTAKTILLDFKKETGYSHPFLKDVEGRLSSLKKDKN